MWLCTRCWKEIKPDDELMGCPSCGQRETVPVDLDDKETITLPWEMFHILTVWAERWAMACRNNGMCRVVYEIADRIMFQCASPRNGLTLMSEISDLRGKGLNVEVYDTDSNPLD